MARRKAAMHRKRKQNRFAMFLVSFALLMLLAAVGVKRIELESKQDAYLQKEAELQERMWLRKNWDWFMKMRLFLKKSNRTKV